MTTYDADERVEADGSSPRHRREVVSAVLLAAASVATALSLYQATRWNGAMLIAFNNSARSGAEAREFETQLAVERAADVAAWNAFRQAEEDGDFWRADFLAIEVFSDQLRDSYLQWEEGYYAASDALGFGWEDDPLFRYDDFDTLPYDQQLVAIAAATGMSIEEAEEAYPEENVGGVIERQNVFVDVFPPSPLLHPSYRQSETAEEASRLADLADAEFRAARDANWNSDRYVLNTVLFSMTLFFAGIASKFTSKRLQTALLSLSAIFLVAGAALFAYLPFY